MTCFEFPKSAVAAAIMLGLLPFGWSPAALAAQEVSQTFTLDGRLYSNTAGTTPMQENPVELKLQILNNNQTCILYEETQNVNTSSTSGFFTIQVGSASGAGKRTAFYSARTMQSVYSNTVASIAGKLVSDGTDCTYNPSAGHVRYLRVLIKPPDNVTRVISPNMPITSVPTSLVAERAESVQGYSASQLLLVNTNAPISLSQTNLEDVFSTANFAKLQDLLDGTSTQYIPSSPGTLVDFNGQRLTDIATPTAATDATNKDYVDTRIGGAALDVTGVGLGVGGGSTLVWDQAANEWVAQAPGAGYEIVAGTGLLGGTLSAGDTISIDVGTTANKIVQLTNTGVLPALDGWLLTNLNAPVLSVAGRTGVVSLNAADITGLGTASTKNYGTAANNLVELTNDAALPAVDGYLLTNVNATRLRSYAIAATAPADNQILTWNNTTAVWEPRSPAVAGITDLTGDLTATGPGSAVATIANSSITAAKINATGYAINRLLITDGTNPNLVTYATCTDGEILVYGPTGWLCNSMNEANAFFQGGNAFGTVATLGTTDTTNLNIITNNATRLTVTSAGNVGVGTSAPTSQMQVVGDLTATRLITTNTYPSTVLIGEGTSNNHVLGQAVIVGSNARSTGGYGVVAIGHGAQVNGDRDIAIGAGATVTGAQQGIAIGNAASVTGMGGIAIGRTAAAAAAEIVIGGDIGQGGVSNMYIGRGKASATPMDMAINAGGGLGTNIPGASFSLRGGRGTGTGLGGALLFETSPAGGSSGSAANASAERMRITPVGNVGVGTTTPQSILDLTSTGTNSALIVPRDTTANRPAGNVADGMIRYNTDDAKFEFYQAGAWVNYGTGGGTVGSVVAGTGLSPLTITSTGTLNVDVGVTANKIVQLTADAQLPAVDGNLISNVNAVKIQTRDIASTAPSDNQVLTWNNTTSVWEPRSAQASSNAFVQGGNAFGQVATLGTTDATNLNIITNNANRLTITATGNVGIGTSTPASPLHVVGRIETDTLVANNLVKSYSDIDADGDIGADGDVSSQGSFLGLGGSVGAATYSFSFDKDTGIFSPGADTLAVSTNGNERARFTSTGNLGLGTTSPRSILELTSTGTNSALIVPRDTTANRPAGNVADGMIRYNTDDAKFEFYQAGAWVNYGTGGGTVGSVVAGTGLSPLTITSTGTLNIDVGVTANKVVQLTADAQLPAVDGNLISNVNAVKLQTLDIAATAPSDNQVLTWNSTTSVWEPRSAQASSNAFVQGGNAFGGKFHFQLKVGESAG